MTTASGSRLERTPSVSSGCGRLVNGDCREDMREHGENVVVTLALIQITLVAGLGGECA